MKCRIGFGFEKPKSVHPWLQHLCRYSKVLQGLWPVKQALPILGTAS